MKRKVGNKKSSEDARSTPVEKARESRDRIKGKRGETEEEAAARVCRGSLGSLSVGGEARTQPRWAAAPHLG